ncbi:MAG TPA: tRNA (adenosine(37)-N6)-dimethylallyltransferase MiaA [Candidatus Udaeobacter sp.]|nr:tRNA (adenosine(37)-N6)-dimethylallyltransferase MiaA [Candidatus Udaeobacter sp.]
MKKLPKVIVILGPTASGKTDLGLELAKKFNGEVISADSRQVYKKMSIGTAKPAGVWQKESYIVAGISHHLMDIVDPSDDFSLSDYKALANEKIKDVLSRKKLPIIVGGTGLYVQTLVDNLDIPKIPPNKDLREKLEQKTLPELVAMLEKIDQATAKKIDLKNPRRVLRALEVCILSGKSFLQQQTKSKPLYDVLQIGINLPSEELYSRINKRVDKQIADGLIEETKQLAAGYGWDLPSMSGIGYKQIGFYLRDQMSLAEAVELLKRDTRRYAKRQMTWFKRDRRIIWLENPDKILAENLIQKFLSE